MTYEEHEKRRQENLKFWGMVISMSVICGAIAWAFSELRNHF
tara:strand:+ start:2436 stop:2561 length:126 start_codon:yes stop_codon:yes gene_type:complete